MTAESRLLIAESLEKFVTGPFPSISLIGMSGVGKSFLSRRLSETDNWYHFSVDYLIGNHYLADQIPNYQNVTKDDITPIADYLGLLGAPQQGGRAHKQFRRRQRLYHDAELLASQALADFIRVAKQGGHPALINDTAGSFCELNYAELPEIISEQSLIVYIKASQQEVSTLLERSQASPKPLLYRERFLQEKIAEFLAIHNLDDIELASPAEFFHWVFPQLVQSRAPRYQAIAERYGIILRSEQLRDVASADEFLQLVTDGVSAKDRVGDVGRQNVTAWYVQGCLVVQDGPRVF